MVGLYDMAPLFEMQLTWNYHCTLSCIISACLLFVVNTGRIIKRGNPFGLSCLLLILSVSFANSPHSQFQIELCLHIHFNNLRVNFNLSKGRYHNFYILKFIFDLLCTIFEPNFGKTNIKWLTLLCIILRFPLIFNQNSCFIIKILSWMNWIHVLLRSTHIFLIDWNFV